MAIDWTEIEVRAIVQDYFDMLMDELAGKKYNKSRHRTQLLPKLTNRKDGSVEFKHQNISAVLANMGLPYIKGYLPRFNYQKELLEKVVAEIKLENRINFENSFESFSNKTPHIVENKKIDFSKLLTTGPSTSEFKETEPTYRPVRINYLEKEQFNRSLGESGEKLVLEYERWNLINSGKESLADKVEWVSKNIGDGTWFDILSKNLNGTDKYIEVKTTKLSKEAPIFLSKNEVSFATKMKDSFLLYRVFNFEKIPQFFIKRGEYVKYCYLEAQTFKGFFV